MQRVISKPITLNGREQKTYSLSRAILSAAGGGGCFEREISQELERQLSSIAPNYERKGGVLIPTGLSLTHQQRNGYQQRAGLDTGTLSKGEELTFDDPGSFIDLLRPHTWVLQLGATLLTGLKGDVGFPRASTGGVVTWVTENPGADTAQSDLVTQEVFLTCRTAQSTTSFSRQLLAQSTPSVDAVVATDLAKAHAAALDKAALQGTAPAPVGLNSQLIINMGVPATSYAVAVDMEHSLLTANAGRNMMDLAYLAHPDVAKALKLKAQDPTITWPSWYARTMNGLRAEISNNMPAGILFLGDWPELLIGEWGILEILTDPFTKKKQGMIEVTSFMLADVELRHLNSFAKTT